MAESVAWKRRQIITADFACSAASETPTFVLNVPHLFLNFSLLPPALQWQLLPYCDGHATSTSLARLLHTRLCSSNCVTIRYTSSVYGVTRTENRRPYCLHSNRRATRRVKVFDSKHVVIRHMRRHIVTQFSVTNGIKQIYQVCGRTCESFIKLRSTTKKLYKV
jgi:hypothetical protein